LLLGYLRENNLPLTAESLVQGFEALKSRLELADRDVSSGPVRVVEFAHEETRSSIRRKVERFNSAEMREWELNYPEERAILDGE
jgi:hypothetical protein